MNRADQEKFLDLVASVTKEDPTLAPRIMDACSRGIGVAILEEREKSADMECALAALVTDRKSDWARDVLRQKLEKWQAKLSLRWDWFLDTLKKRAA